MPDAASQKPAKRKAMVYVPADVHRSMELMAVERGRSVSDLYVEAARAFIERGGEAPAPSPRPSGAPMPPSDPAASDGVLAQIMRRLDDLAVGGAGHGAHALPPVEARAVAVTLGALTRVGTAGLAREGMLNILVNEGFSRETGAAVIHQLREFGLVASKNMRLTLRTPADALPTPAG